MSATKICPQCSAEYEADQRFCPRDGSTLKSLAGGGDLVGSVIADRYHVIRKLGEGGMGQVYLAEHVRMGRKSAVKVMNPSMVNDADAISRFNREASNASRISHPNVAAIYDFGETPDGIIYLAMEFVEGEPLTALIERQGALPASRAAIIVRQTGDALAVAHDLGIVHRDLKPDNIMVARDRHGADCVKVVDFGIAKAANNDAQKVTRTGLVVGTPEYMSPEQLAGDPLDGRSDIYSLGLVAFNMLTGRLPFPSETAQESMIMRLTDRPRTLLEMKPDVSWPPRLQAVLDRALARDARDRYASAAEFGRDLSQAIEQIPLTVETDAKTSIMSQPVPTTRVTTAPTRLTPTAEVKRRRNVPLIVGVSTVVVGGLVAFGLFSRASRSPSTMAAISPTDATRPAAHMSDGAQRDSGLATRTESIASGNSTSPGQRLPLNPALRSSAAGTAATTAQGSMTTAAIRQAIDEIKRQSDPSDPAANPAVAISRANSLLPKLRDGGDSVETLYYRAQAQAASDESGACATFTSIAPRAQTLHHRLVTSINVALQACNP